MREEGVKGERRCRIYGALEARRAARRDDGETDRGRTGRMWA